MTRLYANVQVKVQFIEFRITSKNDGQSSNDLSAQAPTVADEDQLRKKKNILLFFYQTIKKLDNATLYAEFLYFSFDSSSVLMTDEFGSECA